MNTITATEEMQRMEDEGAAQAKNAATKPAADAVDTAKETSSMLSKEVSNFIADVEDLITEKTGGALDVGKIKSEITSRIAAYKATAQSTTDQALSQAKEKVASVDSYVRDEPWKAVAAGFGVGLLVGVIISRR